jgi:hypothetical protein
MAPYPYPLSFEGVALDLFAKAPQAQRKVDSPFNNRA